MKIKTSTFIFSILISGVLIMVANACKKSGSPVPLPNTVTDIDGNVYHSTTIGSQVWFVENLKTTRYRNGDTIPNVPDSVSWMELQTGAYCNYDNNSANSAIYGRMYNWYAVTDCRNIAPIGWHIPSDAEWTTLSNYLGGEDLAGGQLKSTGTTQWINPNAGATNSSGFTGLPGGCRHFNASFHGNAELGYWWSATAFDANVSWRRELNYDNSQVSRLCDFNTHGFSVRCVKDH